MELGELEDLFRALVSEINARENGAADMTEFWQPWGVTDELMTNTSLCMAAEIAWKAQDAFDPSLDDNERLYALSGLVYLGIVFGVRFAGHVKFLERVGEV